MCVCVCVGGRFLSTYKHFWILKKRYIIICGYMVFFKRKKLVKNTIMEIYGSHGDSFF